MSYETSFSVHVGDDQGDGFTCSSYELDVAMSRYLPASIAGLRELATDRMDGFTDLSGVDSLAALLVILADLDRGVIQLD